MKPAAILSMVLAALQFAVADDFKTIDGREYKNVTVSRVEPDGIVLTSKSGISKVYFVELPKEIQERFHYDAPKAATQNAVVSSVTPVPHVDSSAGPTKWDYSEYPDQMGRGTTKVAQVASSNTVRFGFPYVGETHAVLQLRNSPKSGHDIMLRVERGQFLSSYTTGFVTVRFDDGELQKFTIGEPEGGKSNLRFIHDNEDGQFMSQLRKAKSLKIEANFYQEGPRVFEFEVGGLDW